MNAKVIFDINLLSLVVYLDVIYSAHEFDSFISHMFNLANPLHLYIKRLKLYGLSKSSMESWDDRASGEHFIVKFTLKLEFLHVDERVLSLEMAIFK